MYIAPSILSANFGNLNDDIKKVCEAGADMIHVDVMDGHFVPNLTIGPVVVEAVKKASSVPLDIHLMVKDITKFVDMFAKFKPRFISFHIEEENHVFRLANYIKNFGINPAIVLNPHTSLSSLEYILDEISMVLLMSVNPGFGGQSFIPQVLPKIEKLRNLIDKRGAKCMIEVDGGVNGLNIADIANAGADIVVAGNFIFSSQDYKEAIKALRV